MSAVLFFDIDGTLLILDDTHRMPESTKRALLQAKENGHKIFINTGRVKTAIDKALLEFGFDGLVCGCGTYVEYEGQQIFHNRLKEKQCRAYADKLKLCGCQTVYEGKERLFIDGDYGSGGFLEYIYTYFSKNTDVPIADAEDEDLLYDKFTTYLPPECDKERFVQMFEGEFHLIPHGGNVIEAVPKGYSKATGIHLVLDYLGIPIEECYAFGDSINDMEMLQAVTHSVGLGNAVAEVRSIVEYVTADIVEDGIEKALQHYGLIH